MRGMAMRVVARRAMKELGWRGDVEYVESFVRRLVGMMLRARMCAGDVPAATVCPADAAGASRILVFPRCRSIHTCWMSVPLDVAFADASGKVVAWYPRLAPWSVRSCPKAAFVLERVSSS